MKKITLLGICLILSISFSFAQKDNFSIAYYIDSMWGEWDYVSSYVYNISGSVDDFVIKNSRDHPSNYFLRIKVDNFTIPSRSEYKRRKKKNEWHEYEGTIEYFYRACDGDNFKSRAKGGFSYTDPTAYDEGGELFNEKVLKATKRIVVRIAPFKKHPSVYNIYFDDIGIGIVLH